MKITSCQRVVEILLEKMQPLEKKALQNTPKDDLIVFHHTVGRGIRNTFEMFSNKELLKSCQEIRDGVVLDSLEKVTIHPDDASQFIIEEIWKKVQK